MITVIAFIKVKPENLEQFIGIFKENVPEVLKEEGCIEYYPTVDLDASLKVQIMDEATVTIIEKWDSVNALEKHMASPHMQAYRKKTGAMVEKLSIRVLRQV